MKHAFKLAVAIRVTEPQRLLDQFLPTQNVPYLNIVD